MFAGHIDNLSREQAMLPLLVQKALSYLKDTDMAAIAVGRHDILGEDMFVLVSEYDTEQFDARRPEAHESYADVQYVISGQEIIGYSNKTPELKMTENLLAMKDLAFYQPPADESELKLTSGMYAVFYPWDIHRPNCNYNGVNQVRKAVVKIRLSLLTGASR